MSGDTQDPQVPDQSDGSAFPPPPPPVVASDAGTPDVAVPDVAVPDTVIPDVAVPDLDIPVPEIEIPEFSVPEPPALEIPEVEIPPLDEAALGLTDPLPTRSGLRAQAAADVPAPADASAPAAPAADAPVFSPATPSVPATAFPEPAMSSPAPQSDASAFTTAPASGAGYGGWTIAIFVGLLALLVAAIVGLVLLFNFAPLTFDSSSDDAPTSQGGGTDVVVTVDDPVLLDGCDALCMQIGGVVEADVTANDGVVWTRVNEWQNSRPLVSSAAEATTATYRSDVSELNFTVMEFADDAAMEAAGADLKAQWGDTLESEASVYEDGTGTSNVFADGESRTVLWFVPEVESRVLLVEGPDDESVFQFYLALPI